MHIHIIPGVEEQTLGGVTASIIAAGHLVTESPFDASYVVGTIEQEFPSTVPKRQRIILIDSLAHDLPGDAILCNIGTLRIFGIDRTLSQWLRNAEDLLAPQL